MHPKDRKNKPQLRTTETLARILDAAEQVFSGQGFEMTQLEEVAARAGFTRGAIYAHFSSKEDLFLALMEQRVLSRFTRARSIIEAEPDLSRRMELFRNWIGEQAVNRSWGILMLEFKLYALRRPRSLDKLRDLYNRMATSSRHDFIDLFAEAGDDPVRRLNLERRLSVFGAVLGAVLLESHFRPQLFPEEQLKQVYEALTRDLLHEPRAD